MSDDHAARCHGRAEVADEAPDELQQGVLIDSHVFLIDSHWYLLV
jgi:hypothetical protein